jgi:adenylyltransferase/sulfurtransferase
MKKFDRYIRQTTFSELGVQGQRRLGQARVLLVGCGALGSAIAVSLVRSGIRELTIVDQDFPEITNLHRQFLYDEDDVRKKIPKPVAAAQKLRRANSTVKLIPRVTELTANNIEQLARGKDLILDGTDNLETRYLINDYCVKNRRPWIYGGVIGASGMMMFIFPRQTPCLRCLFPVPPTPGSLPTCASAGVLNPAPMLVGAMQAIAAIKYLSGKSFNPGLHQFDLWAGWTSVLKLQRQPGCPACGRHKFEFLAKKPTELTARVCAENAVKIIPPRNLRLNLRSLRARLARLGRARFNGWLIEAKVRGREIIIFADGRAIIRPMADGQKAVALYHELLIEREA